MKTATSREQLFERGEFKRPRTRNFPLIDEPEPDTLTPHWCLGAVCLIVLFSWWAA